MNRRELMKLAVAAMVPTDGVSRILDKTDRLAGWEGRVIQAGSLETVDYSIYEKMRRQFAEIVAMSPGSCYLHECHNDDGRSFAEVNIDGWVTYFGDQAVKPIWHSKLIFDGHRIGVCGDYRPWERDIWHERLA